jgi:glycosyltransferase involved in cell wall biosynthesis
MEKEERAWCPKVSLNVTVSEDDSRYLSQLAPEARFAVVPNGVDTGFFTPGDEDLSAEGNVVFVGGTTWFPNKDALQFFSESILPAVRAKSPGCTATWVGRATEKERSGFGQVAGLSLTGYVPDVRPYVQRAGCFVVPLRVGGGTRLKILDAWAMGKAVVSTSIGCEGLDAVDGENILVRDSPEDFAEAVSDVLLNMELRNRLGRKARATVESTYSWTVIGKKMHHVYENLLP